jgi:hypothetical protein
MKVDERGLYSIYDIWHVPFWQTSAFYITLSAVLGILFGFLIWFLIKRLRNKKPAITSWEQALQRITALQQRSCQTRQEGKEIYSLLIAELKNYCTMRYQHLCHTKTDHEFLLSMHTQVSADIMSQLEDIIQGGILVKFANEHMIQDHVKKHIAQGIHIIQMTMPQQQKSL